MDATHHPAPTRTIRVPCDIAEMLSAIQRHGRSTILDVVEPLLRRPVERLFEKLPMLDQQYARERIARLTGEPEAATATASAK